MESDLAVEICWMLKEEIDENHFGIITPYRGQVNLTQKRLKQRYIILKDIFCMYFKIGVFI